MTGPLSLTLIKGRPLWYRVRRSRRARRPGVEVCRRDGVVVILPWRAASDVVPQLLTHWADWLEAKADQYGVRQGPTIRQYATGSVLSILGVPRRLQLSALPAGRRGFEAQLGSDTLSLIVPPACVFDPRPVLEKYLRRLAREHLIARVAFWAEKVGRVPQRVIVGERTSRWGSCSPRGTLSFCYRLIMAPPEVGDAVVAHEVCHLVHLNHGRRFHALLNRVCPGQDEAMTWLRNHEDDLLL